MGYLFHLLDLDDSRATIEFRYAVFLFSKVYFCYSLIFVSLLASVSC